MVYQGSYDLRKDVDKLRNRVEKGAVDSTSYFLQSSTPVVTFDESYSPSAVTFNSYIIDNGLTDLFDCTLLIEGSSDGVTYSTITSNTDAHTISTAVTSTYRYYRGCMMVDDNVLDYQTVRVLSNTESFSVFLGNESQLIPCDSEGELINTFTFRVPFYCYKGMQKYPCLFNNSDSNIPDEWMSYSIVQSATVSNNGEMELTVFDTPDTSEGQIVLAFDVDNETIYCILSYTKTEKGAKGEDGQNGIDGNGYHYIFYRTTTNTAPSKPVFGSTTIIDNTDISGEDLTGGEWFETAISPTAQFPYLWCSYRMFNGQDSRWGAFCTPYLYEKYTYYGSDGNKGNSGVHGVDGSVIDGETIKYKTTDTISRAMNDSVPSNFVSDISNSKTYDIGGRDTYLNRQGNIVLLNLRGTFQQPTVSSDEYVTVRTLESWAIPLTDTYFGDALHDTPYKIINDNGTAKLQVFATTSNNGSVINMASSTMYFADDSQRPSSQITQLTGYNIAQGEAVTVQLLDDSDQPLANKKIYFKVNEVIYQRETNTVGVASLNMNLYGNKEIVVWYDGYEYDNGQIQNLSDNTGSELSFEVFVKQAFIKDIEWGEDAKGYYAEVKTNTGTPLRYHDAELSIGGSEFWTAQTNGEGRVYFDLMGYKDDVEVIIQLPTRTGRVYDGAREKHIFVRSQLSTFTETYYPTSITNNQDYEYLDPKNLSSINDMRYVQSIEVPYNYELSELKLNYDDLDIPLSATMQRVDVEVRFTGLEGDKQLQRPSWKAPQVTLYLENEESIILNGRPSSVQSNYTNCGKWKKVEYSTTFANEEFTLINLMGIWKNLKLGLDDLTNLGGGDNHQDSGRFAIDYVKLKLTYTVDNDMSLITTDVPSLTLYTEDLEILEKSNARFYARLYEDNEPVENATITIHYNGVDFVRTTDSNGEVSIGTNTTSGNYAVTTTYTEDDVTISKTNVIKIKPRIVSSSLTKVFRCNTQYEVLLLDVNGNPAMNETVDFNINGVFYSRQSDGNGKVKLNINLEPNTYVVTTSWQGMSISDEITITTNIHTSDLYMTYGDGSQFVANITDCSDRPVEGKAVRFNINGMFYNRISDSNGDAKLNINLMAGNYVITTSYNGLTVSNMIYIRSV